MTEDWKKRSSAHQTILNCDNVLQQIQVEKQEFRCIINLNTTVCTNNLKHRKKCYKKHSSKHSERNRNKETQTNEKTNMTRKKGDHRKEEVPTNVEHERERGTRKKEELSQKVEYKTKETPKSKCPVSYRSANDRIVPICSRSACWDRYESRKESLRRKNAVQIHLHNNSKKRALSNDHVEHEELKKPRHHHHHHHHHKCKHSRQTIIQTESRILLSPISSLPLENEDNLTYEDISSASFEVRAEEKPMAYKRHRKHCNHVREHRHNVQESKLDTLIRRTKERERILVERSRCNYQPWFTSTPIYYNEYSSADFAMSSSDMDNSLHSLPTLVLETKHYNAYSPSCPIEDIQNSKDDFQIEHEDIGNLSEDEQILKEDFQSTETEKLCCRGYSPSSPSRNYTPKPQMETDYNLLNMKTEPTMDIEAYSPTSTPIIKYAENGVKREKQFKTEPLFTCEISPIYFENMDTIGLEFCKKENVKSEFMDGHVD